MIENYRNDAIQVFQLHTLHQWDFRSRAVLCNKSDENAAYADDYWVDLTIRYDSGEVRKFEKIVTIAPGEVKALECDSFFESQIGKEGIFTFHLIPKRFYESKFVSIGRETLYFYLTIQDHYVEYFKDSGYCTGVLYQSGPFNYKKFNADSNTVIQAPKSYVASDVRTYLSVINSSIEDVYSVDADFRCALVDQGGAVVKKWKEVIPAHTFRLIDISTIESEVVKHVGFYGFCSNATLLPLTITRCLKTNTLGIEHSLPPTYYGDGVKGAGRRALVEQLKLNALFKEEMS